MHVYLKNHYIFSNLSSLHPFFSQKAKMRGEKIHFHAKMDSQKVDFFPMF